VLSERAVKEIAALSEVAKIPTEGRCGADRCGSS
jgi:hypothetical protein